MYWQRVHNEYRLCTSTMFNYRLGSRSRFNCRLYIGNGLNIITGYALAECSPTTKCWHQVDPLQRPMGAFSQFSPLGEALPEPLPHITNLKPKDFILHILYFQWMPFYKVCKKPTQLELSPMGVGNHSVQNKIDSAQGTPSRIMIPDPTLIKKWK